ncbi:YbaK/EbsC family protein [Protaetiibacter mangrovi]|uniref:YbaK/EbsC family protein n=1 Tax=Protaetiibacter mangrovi TaxID=2970926 RepID=A0ABT1ZC49_9MICO|nr:YbaK/EbsC family protein [Protaetiibacter mangrovi]MCS0498282.1 YbaK/EbsC family protein [Protaetiibacter mangrovi]TPX03220.1 YbaK/EbsC family protein [Schumannella luteola]
MAVADYVERLRGLGLDVEVREFPEGTHTAQDAADAIGCPVAAIVKSLVFALDDEPLLVLVSGANRVDTELLGARLGGVLGKADARTVKAATGYSIGGVPPLAHPTPLRTVVDEDLLLLDTVWAAAGSASTVFPLDPAELVRLSAGEVLPVA